MKDFTNDIPKYKKKSTASPPAKAKHKHEYVPCLIEHPWAWLRFLTSPCWMTMTHSCRFDWS